MTKPKHYRRPIWDWRVSRHGLYAKLGALGGMTGAANTKIKPDWSWQGRLMLEVGYRSFNWQPTELFEVKVIPAERKGNHLAHRIHLRCPHCYSWVPFGRLHQHILSKRCCEAAVKANTLPATPSLRSDES